MGEIGYGTHKDSLHYLHNNSKAILKVIIVPIPILKYSGHSFRKPFHVIL